MVEQVPPSVGFLYVVKPGGWSAIKNVAPVLACCWPDINNPVGTTDDIKIMFDHEE